MQYYKSSSNCKFLSFLSSSSTFFHIIFLSLFCFFSPHFTFSLFIFFINFHFFLFYFNFAFLYFFYTTFFLFQFCPIILSFFSLFFHPFPPSSHPIFFPNFIFYLEPFSSQSYKFLILFDKTVLSVF